MKYYFIIILKVMAIKYYIENRNLTIKFKLYTFIRIHIYWFKIISLFNTKMLVFFDSYIKFLLLYLTKQIV